MEKELIEYEKKQKTIEYQNIHSTCDSITKLLGIVNELNKLLRINTEIYNIGITVNNKIVELSHKFNEKNISLFASKYYDQINDSYLGIVIMDYLHKSAIEGMDILINYVKEINDYLNKFKNYYNLQINYKNPSVQEKVKYFYSLLEEYIRLDDEIFKFNIEHNLLEVINKRLCGDYEKDGSSLLEVYLKIYVIPDLKKLGMSVTAKDMLEDIKKEYSKVRIKKKNEGK